jgi:hypothetical protein
MGKVMRRRVRSASDKRIAGAKTYDYIDRDSYAWIGGADGVKTTEIPNYIEIDIERPMMFRTLKNIYSSGLCKETENQISRTYGSFIADGWVAGMSATIEQTGLNNGLTVTIKKVEELILTIVETMDSVNTLSAVITSSIEGDGVLAGHLLFGRTLIYAQPWYAEFEWEADQIRSVDYFNYESRAYDSTPATSFDIGRAVAAYLYYRFAPAFQTIEAVYGDLRANNGTTNSQANSMSLMRTQIDDGTGSKYYYATSVRKIPGIDDGKTRTPTQLAVLWNEE